MESRPQAMPGEILALNTDLFRSVLRDVPESLAAERIGGANPPAFLAAHLLDARCYLSGLLGAPVENPIGDALRDARSADEVDALPSLAAVLAEWDRVSPHLEAALAAATAAQLDGPSPQRFPVRDATLGAGVAFLLQHESYHLGQLALLRRQLGLPAMTYERREERSP
jgi:uncharacterized damage-inducible protein DinB